jgi:hypothetical protein
LTGETTNVLLEVPITRRNKTSGIWVVLSSIIFLKDMTILQFLFLYLQPLLGHLLWIHLLWYLLMEHHQSNHNLLPINHQYLEVVTEAEVEAEVEVEAEAEVHNSIRFKSSPMNYQHLLHLWHLHL